MIIFHPHHHFDDFLSKFERMLPGIMREVECDASFDVVSEAEVAQRRQGHVKHDDDTHANVEGLRESFRFAHLIL